MCAKDYDYAKICNSILSVNPKIRFAGVISEHGRLVAGGMKDNVKPLESETDDVTIFMELALRVQMRKEFDKQLGPVKFAMSSRKHVLAISIILDKDILYVVSEPDADYTVLIKQIFEIVES